MATHLPALLEDGTVQAWGRSDHGGSSVPSGLAGVLTCILFITNDANLPERLREMVRMARLNDKFARRDVAPMGLLLVRKSHV